MFITFEGVDYSGKTTQAALAAERLTKEGREVIALREPGGTEVSEQIRTILLGSTGRIDPAAELLLFAAARAQLSRDVIIPGLRRKCVVVCDRFYDSTTAYQGYGRGLNMGDVAAVNRIAAGEAVPDLTIVVDIGPETARARRENGTGPRSGRSGAPDRIERSGDDFFSRVRKGYASIAAAEPNRVSVVDGGPPPPEVHEAIWKIIQQRMTQKR